MPRIFSQIIEDLKSGENLDLYIIIPIAFAVAVWGFLGASIIVLTSVILGVLGILAGSLLANRKAVSSVRDASNHLSNEIHELRSTLSSPKLSDVLQDGYPDFSNHFANAKFVGIIGRSLYLTNEHYIALRHSIAKNGTIHFLTNAPTLEVMQNNTYFGTAGDEPEAMIANMKNIFRSIKQLSQTNNSKGEVELRTLTYPPHHFGLIIIDSFEGWSRIYVRLNPVGMSISKPPVFEVDSSRDAKLFHYFREQYNNLWSLGSEVD